MQRVEFRKAFGAERSYNMFRGGRGRREGIIVVTPSLGPDSAISCELKPLLDPRSKGISVTLPIHRRDRSRIGSLSVRDSAQHGGWFSADRYFTYRLHFLRVWEREHRAE